MWGWVGGFKRDLRRKGCEDYEGYEGLGERVLEDRGLEMGGVLALEKVWAEAGCSARAVADAPPAPAPPPCGAMRHKRRQVMADPALAAGFSNPKVQQAIFDISQNPMNISKYQARPSAREEGALGRRWGLGALLLPGGLWPGLGKGGGGWGFGRGKRSWWGGVAA